jgi:hypothetical protein
MAMSDLFPLLLGEGQGEGLTRFSPHYSDCVVEKTCSAVPQEFIARRTSPLNSFGRYALKKEHLAETYEAKPIPAGRQTLIPNPSAKGNRAEHHRRFRFAS